MLENLSNDSQEIPNDADSEIDYDYLTDQIFSYAELRWWKFTVRISTHRVQSKPAIVIIHFFIFSREILNGFSAKEEAPTHLPIDWVRIFRRHDDFPYTPLSFSLIAVYLDRSRKSLRRQ